MKGGFTLIELLLILGIVSIIMIMGTPITINHYQSYRLISERDNLLGFLRRARTLSLANRNSLAHGLYIENNRYTIFEGPNFTSRQSAWDEVFDKSGAVEISGSTEIIFSSLGATTTSSALTLSIGSQTFTININEAGGIAW